MPPKRQRKKTQLTSKKTIANASENVSEKSAIAKEAEKFMEFLHSNQKKDGYWEASPTLAGFLKLPLHRFDIGHEESNFVWCTVLVLIYCMTAVLDYHEYWKLLAEKAREWLFNQRFFTTATLQLVKRACTLYTDVDYKGMLSTIFAKAGDGTTDTDIEPIKRGNWVQMVLETPPYTKYYLNEVTKEAQWEHPMDPHEPTFEEKKATEKLAAIEKAKNDKLAIILPQRITINRSKYMPPRPQECESCAKGISAVVLCVICDEYECQDCCDVIHMNPKKKDHLQSFRFISCYGKHGFPYLRPSLKALQEKMHN
ncbi:hypothetical protein THRCLA_04523 [Thraustotheca clavata]|uniref:WW domain-containing protein n=1 Tax=Thraustotheca clavata TaxID=74557 RepID=A0A1V9ZYR4_9STRA|nr:hypothetical protein THRCLA_04523 [Thraustotheca clavata]